MFNQLSTKRLHLLKAFFLSNYFSILSVLLFTQLSYAQTNYKEEIELWHSNRIQNLKSETGWLNLAGLEWLKEGINTVGDQNNNDIHFPKGTANNQLCKLILNHEEVTLICSSKDSITSNDNLLNGSTVVFNPKENIDLQLKHKRIVFFVIKRGAKIGVRIRNLDSENIKKFAGIPRFDVDINWRIKAQVSIPETPKTVDIIDVLGNTTKTSIGAILNFTINGKNYKLIGTKEDDKLFIVFSDNTSGMSTYGSGRFLYVDFPPNSKEVIIDFNKAYNPPCAFTPYATCPLPLKENTLDAEITAGERSYTNH